MENTFYDMENNTTTWNVDVKKWKRNVLIIENNALILNMFAGVRRSRPAVPLKKELGLVGTGWSRSGPVGAGWG